MQGRSIIVALSLCVSAGAAAGAERGDAGAKLLRTQGCVQCHAARAAGIDARRRGAGAEGPDLSSVATRYDGAALGRYLRRETAGPGRHAHGFKGSDEELQALIDWLLEQKQ